MISAFISQEPLIADDCERFTQRRKIVLRPYLSNGLPLSRKLVEADGAEILGLELLVRRTLQRSRNTLVPPFVEAVYCSRNIDCPSLLPDLDLSQRLVILRASCCSCATGVWAWNAEEILGIANVFTKLIKGFQELQMRNTLVGRDSDDRRERCSLREISAFLYLLSS